MVVPESMEVASANFFSPPPLCIVVIGITYYQYERKTTTTTTTTVCFSGPRGSLPTTCTIAWEVRLGDPHRFSRCTHINWMAGPASAAAIQPASLTHTSSVAQIAGALGCFARLPSNGNEMLAFRIAMTVPTINDWSSDNRANSIASSVVAGVSWGFELKSSQPWC